MTSDDTRAGGPAVPRPQLVLCGSMKVLDEMERLRSELGRQGITALAPEPDRLPGAPSPEALLDLKRSASRLHMSWIKDPATRAILVVNHERAGVPDYIGPNAFAEIAVAFCEERAVFLLNGVPDNYEDELRAWRVTALQGDLSPLVAFFDEEART